jgi:putative holliday junction resolvase
MSILALDVGNVWTGTALSDTLCMVAQPYQTSKTKEIFPFLRNLFEQKKIETILVGLPKTMKGTDSDQTKKVRLFTEKLKLKFPTKNWILWDERLSSKHAAKLTRPKTKEDKIRSHSVAAAFMLDSYLCNNT